MSADSIFTALIACLFLLLGAAWGTVLNWFSGSVTEEGELRFKAPSCRKCGMKLQARSLVPVLGYFMAGRRCPGCSESLPARAPVVEAVTGILFVALYLRYGLSWPLVILLVYSTVLIILFVTDLEHFILPNLVTYPALLLAALVALAVTLAHIRLPWALFFAGTGFMALFNNFILCALAGGVCGALLLFLVVVLSKGGMGLGDVVLAGLLGLMVGFPLVFIALFIGILAGGIVAAVLLISRRKKRREMIPFGPFLCLGGIVTLLWGKELLGWYLGLI
jgi:leader peptidase (prepilin peptidase) / N-methyltransferase